MDHRIVRTTILIVSIVVSTRCKALLGVNSSRLQNIEADINGQNLLSFFRDGTMRQIVFYQNGVGSEADFNGDDIVEDTTIRMFRFIYYIFLRWLMIDDLEALGTAVGPLIFELWVALFWTYWFLPYSKQDSRRLCVHRTKLWGGRWNFSIWVSYKGLQAYRILTWNNPDFQGDSIEMSPKCAPTQKRPYAGALTLRGNSLNWLYVRNL